MFCFKEIFLLENLLATVTTVNLGSGFCYFFNNKLGDQNNNVDALKSTSKGEKLSVGKSGTCSPPPPPSTFLLGDLVSSAQTMSRPFEVESVGVPPRQGTEPRLWTFSLFASLFLLLLSFVARTKFLIHLMLGNLCQNFLGRLKTWTTCQEEKEGNDKTNNEIRNEKRDQKTSLETQNTTNLYSQFWEIQLNRVYKFLNKVFTLCKSKSSVSNVWKSVWKRNVLIIFLSLHLVLSLDAAPTELAYTKSNFTVDSKNRL
jgi:hypothetical protein